MTTEAHESIQSHRCIQRCTTFYNNTYKPTSGILSLLDIWFKIGYSLNILRFFLLQSKPAISCEISLAQ